MKALIVLLVFILAFQSRAFAQDHYDPSKALTSEELFLKKNDSRRAITKAGQRYLVLDASPMIGSFHRYRYFPGDRIRFRIKGDPNRFNEEIYSVSDSSFTFLLVNEAARRMEGHEIKLQEIKRIKTYRRIPWVTEGSVLLPIAGLVFVGADFFNKGLDGKRFTTDTQALVVGGALAVTGFLCYKLSFPSVKIKGRNRVKVLQTY
ncbi:hypothetical protein [Salmonirosea aquatica]|uniref:Uncharacterized protein n=1 Tax=Salmonirosea aquatica TaxID=2654236 RepID=A0A7C9FAZ4_9BACT|nr:hypothetical protein [Cytophagaceae bacterium SJW1-29]